MQHQQASAARAQRLPQTVSARVAPALTGPGFGQEQTGRQHRQQGHKRRQQAGQGEAPLGAREQPTQQRTEHQAQAERGAHQPHTAGAIGGRRHICHHRRGHGKITGHDPGQRPRRIDRPQRVGQGEKNVGRGGAEGTDHQNRLAPEAIRQTAPDRPHHGGAERVSGDNQGDIEVIAPQARGDKGQDRNHDPEADHIEQDHRKQQRPVASGPRRVAHTATQPDQR